VPGVSCETILRTKKRFSIDETVVIGILVCRALHHAHKQTTTLYGKTYAGVIHRDLKPANIMIGKDGSVKLTDFGIARPAEVSIHTQDSGNVVGTLPYLAPEQLSGANITAQTDIYALGATLYEFIAGVRAFEQADVTTLVKAKSLGTITPLSAPDLPKGLREIIEKAMALEPGQRFDSAAAMGVALEKVLKPRIKGNPYDILARIAQHI
jgi:serine/threonine-protein kinase